MTQPSCLQSLTRASSPSLGHFARRYRSSRVHVHSRINVILSPDPTLHTFSLTLSLCFELLYHIVPLPFISVPLLPRPNMTFLLARLLLVAILSFATASASSPLSSLLLSQLADSITPTAAPVAKQHEGSVLYDGANYTFHRGIVNSSQAVATGRFVDGLNVTGWGELWLSTTQSFPDDVQMYAAGFLEGALTFSRIEEMYEITVAGMDNDAAIQAFVDNQTEWMAAQVKQHSASNTYWAGVGLVQQQYAGLQAGYNAHVGKESAQLSRYQFDQMQLSADWGDIWYATHRSSRPNFHNMTADETENYLKSIGHCSVLVKVTADFSEVFGAHSTWSGYNTMNRIFKHYNLRLQSSFVAANRVSFSSYPGYLASVDDFYYADSGLVMLETTNGFLNASLWDLIQPHSLFAWERVRLAMLNAASGEQWYKHLAFHNGGTYNNQYAILDMKLFKPYSALQPNTLWVMEQIPGLVYGSDQTHLLSFGYFPSYNVPFFREVYDRSGFEEAAGRLGGSVPGLDFQLAPRALIFRRDQGTVTNMTSFQRLMRYNNYPVDPLSHGHAYSAICARGDLETSNVDAGGCIDTKALSYSTFQNGSAWIVNGPTSVASGGDLPVFNWGPFPDVVRTGVPETMNFPFMQTQW